MPQTKLQVNGMSSRDDAKKIIARGETVENVRMVNANYETGVVVVTHFEGFDTAMFKTAINELGFNAA
ncbi:hypothetical protein HMPREF9370_1490 [Neisseria wadsworthii 9715]|uniref:Uncharacterized protein n=2 Tax=Neisseria TaxID=482 RepID=G4CQY0_9NEIS|nr:hypothetical protein HMPREF9370_1490 [Neisseria wadsworthii 9715]QMT35210.1 hypothetical protein H3L96_09130 [Neisseria wadsworthii]